MGKIIIQKQDSVKLYKIRKTLEELSQKSGRGTELISLYVPKGKQLPFDVVLLDQNMPRKKGTDTAKEILEVRKNQKILFLSAFGQQILENVFDVKEDTVQIIQKPFSLDFLVRKIEGRVINSRANRNLEARLKGEPTNNLMTITQDQEAIR